MSDLKTAKIHKQKDLFVKVNQKCTDRFVKVHIYLH